MFNPFLLPPASMHVLFCCPCGLRAGWRFPGHVCLSLFRVEPILVNLGLLTPPWSWVRVAPGLGPFLALACLPCSSSRRGLVLGSRSVSWSRSSLSPSSSSVCLPAVPLLRLLLPSLPCSLFCCPLSPLSSVAAVLPSLCLAPLVGCREASVALSAAPCSLRHDGGGPLPPPPPATGLLGFPDGASLGRPSGALDPIPAARR